MSAPPDALIASLCQAIYSRTALIDQWQRFDPGLDDGVCYGVRKFDGFDVVVFRGSITAQDWISDLRALIVPTRIGHVHAGFFAGMEHVWSELRPLLSQPVIVAGHSLGAARAAILCGLMVKDGVTPFRRVVFGEPKPGLIDFADLIKAIPAASYRNGDTVHHDLVTDLPPSFPPLTYVHPTPVAVVCAEPDGNEFEKLGVFAWHHIELYVSALAAMSSRHEQRN
jgi:hypothetical protein